MIPIHPSTYVAYTLAVLTGFAFGFVLERAGFGSARKLAAQFYLTDMTVLKVMFTAIVTAMLGMTLLRAVGWVNYDAIWVNPTFLGPQIVGGLIFGVGFVVGGYCPGTSLVAAVSGRLDAIAFLLGTSVGIVGFAGVYDKLAAFAQTGGERRMLTDWLNLPYGVVALGVAVMAIGMFAGGEYLERRFGAASAGAKP
jgi:uncharacterized membrane protein YedE/YeeE